MLMMRMCIRLCEKAMFSSICVSGVQPAGSTVLAAAPSDGIDPLLSHLISVFC